VPAGWGYLHIRDDVPRAGVLGHGDLLADPAFDLEVRDVLERGVEAPQGGGNWRYTLRYDQARCSGPCHQPQGSPAEAADLLTQRATTGRAVHPGGPPGQDRRPALGLHGGQDASLAARAFHASIWRSSARQISQRRRRFFDRGHGVFSVGPTAQSSTSK
jgi:hypothetical protein